LFDSLYYALSHLGRKIKETLSWYTTGIDFAFFAWFQVLSVLLSVLLSGSSPYGFN